MSFRGCLSFDCCETCARTRPPYSSLSFNGILCGFSEIYLDHAVRLRAGKRILTSDFHRTGKAFVKTTKRGLTTLAIPGYYDPPFEITIFMDISVNPGPVSKLLNFMSASTPPIHQPLHLHINHSSIIYLRSQLLSIRAAGWYSPLNSVFGELKACGILRFRGKRAGYSKKNKKKIQHRHRFIIHVPTDSFECGNNTSRDVFHWNASLLCADECQWINDLDCCYTRPMGGVDKTWTPSSGPPSGPLSWPLNFFGENKKDNRLKLDKVRVLHTTASFASVFSSKGFTLTQHICKIIFLVFTNGSGTFLPSATRTISSKLVIFKFHGLPPFYFPPSWGFRWPVPTRGVARHATRSHARWRTVSWDLHL